jgi:hypothetical protein
MMADTLLIDKTEKTPYISLEKGLCLFYGRSIIEDSQKVFKPVIDWLKKYQPDKNVKTVVNFNFDYLNTSSSKCIYDILKVLDELFTNSSDIEINWYYEEGDNDMLDLGVHLKAFIKAPFNFIESEPVSGEEDDM